MEMRAVTRYRVKCCDLSRKDLVPGSLMMMTRRFPLPGIIDSASSASEFASSLRDILCFKGRHLFLWQCQVLAVLFYAKVLSDSLVIPTEMLLIFKLNADSIKQQHSVELGESTFSFHKHTLSPSQSFTPFCYLSHTLLLSVDSSHLLSLNCLSA